MRERIIELVVRGINEGNYNYIREAFRLCYDTDIQMAEDDEFVMVDDEVFYFNGAFD